MNATQRLVPRVVSLAALGVLLSSAQQQGQVGVPVCPFPEILKTVGGSWKRPTAVTENFRQWFAFAGGGSKLRVGRYEREDASVLFEFQDLIYSTGMKITDVGFSGCGVDFYVAGVRATATGCEDVIER